MESFENFELNDCSRSDRSSLCSHAVRSDLYRGSSIEVAVANSVQMMRHAFELDDDESRELMQSMFTQFYGKTFEEIAAEAEDAARQANIDFLDSIEQKRI